MINVKTASTNLPLPSREQAPQSAPGTELEVEWGATGEDTDVRWEMLPCTD